MIQLWLIKNSFFLIFRSQLLASNLRNGGENSDLRIKRSTTAINIEKKIFKTATSRSQYFSMMKEEMHKLQVGYGQ